MDSEAESRGVSYKVLDDVVVLVSEETDANLSNDWRVPIESTQEAGTHFQKVGYFCCCFTSLNPSDRLNAK